MLPAGPAQQPGSDLAQHKLRSEILKLRSERRLLQRQLNRADRPTWWEVVKTVVPWVSIAVGALAFANGYVQSLRQERQQLLQVAMGHYLGDHPEVGAYLLRELATGKDSKSLFSPDPPDVSTYLVQGIEVKSSDPAKASLDHRRNLAALEVLTELNPPVDLLCAKCSAAGSVLDEQLKRPPMQGPEREAHVDEVTRSEELLCQCGALLKKLDESQERCQREMWNETPDDIPLFLDKNAGTCLRRATPRPGSGAPRLSSSPGGEG